MLKLKDVEPNPWNSNFLNKDEFEALKKQVKKSGVENTPSIIVRRKRRKGKKYEIIDGEQRYKIAKELGWKEINATSIDADDLKAKNLCISYNRWRGRLDWFKLCDIMLQDAEAGVDVHKVYRGALSKDEIDKVLSLRNIVPEARKNLRQILEKNKEITLKHLHIFSQFPRDRQDIAVKEFQKKPCSTMALKVSQERAMTGLQRAGETKEKIEKVEKTEETSRIPQGKAVSQVHKKKVKPSRPKPPETPISIISTEYRCPCGRRYLITWGKQWIMTLKKEGEKTEVCEYVSSERRYPYEVEVKCPKCDRINKYFTEGQKTMKKTCWGCNLRGVLDIEAGKARWRRFR